MQRKGAIIFPVLIILIVLSLALASGIYYLYRNEYSQNVKLQGQLTDLENRQKQTVGQLEESKKKAADLELQLQEAKTRIDSLSTELTSEKMAHADTISQLDQLRQDLASQKTQREDLENRLSQVQEDGKQIKEQIRIMQQQKQALEDKIKSLEAGVANIELGKVVVNSEVVQPQAAPAVATKAAEKKNAPEPKAAKQEQRVPAAGGIEGKIMIVNKEFNFVVINLGSKDKVNVGDQFFVSRAGKTIGDIKIEKVHEFMSAAGFAPELKEQFKENDTVTQKSR